jgi:hypothetical protein
MASKRPSSRRERPDEKPKPATTTFRSVSEGKISVTALFDGIYDAVAGGVGRKVAPRELEELRKHLDASLELLEAISKKKRSSER